MTMRVALLTSCLFAPALLFGQILFEDSFQDVNTLNNRKQWPPYREGAEILRMEDGKFALHLSPKPVKPGCRAMVSRQFDLNSVRGKRLTVTADVKWDIKLPFSKWMGSRFMLCITGSDKKTSYVSASIPPGKSDWKPVEFSAQIPDDAQRVMLFLGIQDAPGDLYVRNLKVRSGDLFLDLSSAANMTYQDQQAGDGKGGWSDQGPDNDASGFNFRQTTFANVPFKPLDPGAKKRNTVLTFASPNFPKGLEKAEISLSGTGTNAEYLYLLHTCSWGGTKGPAGFISISGDSGKMQKITVQDSRDVSNWWFPKQVENGAIGCIWSNVSGGNVGLYVTKYKLDSSLGKIRKITLESAHAAPIWIVVGATLSSRDYPFPKTESTHIKADRVWKAVPVDTQTQGIRKGSALDLSRILPLEKVGVYGRVVVAPDGHFTFEKRPDKRIRFMAATIDFSLLWEKNPDLAGADDAEIKRRIREFAEEIRRNGYNMVRLHFFNTAMMGSARQDLEFDPVFFDRFDYMVHSFKENGIYLNWDVWTSAPGFQAGNHWANRVGDKRHYFYYLYVDPKVRNMWKEGVRKFLNRKNPYTGTTLAEDPVLAITIAANEQDGMLRGWRDPSELLPEWKAFLRKRYSSIDALKKAWGKRAAAIRDFDSIPPYRSADFATPDQYGRDITEFIMEKENALVDFYRKSLEEAGYKGLFSQWNMGQELFRNLERQKVDVVTINGYHAHPSAYTSPGSTISQASSISQIAACIRNLNATKLYRKPLVLTEYGHVFWNKYRYEQGFVTGAYSAFQNHDGITGFCNQVRSVQKIKNPKQMWISPFTGFAFDPVAKSQEFLTALMYRRGDVAPAKNVVRIAVSGKKIMKAGEWMDAVHSGQTRLSLVTGFAVDCDSNLPVSPDELILPLSGRTQLNVQEKFIETKESEVNAFDFDSTIRMLKQKKQLPESNRTSAEKAQYESASGELFLDQRKRFMSVDTPRLQGICGEAGTKAKLSNLEIRQMSPRGNLSLASVDGMKDLQQAKRLVVVFATNALNSDMQFRDLEMRVLNRIGTLPVLVETGSFSLTFRNVNAKKMKGYALAMDGSRIAEIPLRHSGNTVELTLKSTAFPQGPAVYFEVVAE